MQFNEDKVLVTYTTAFFDSEERAKEPRVDTPYDYGPFGKSPQCVLIETEEVPDLDRESSVYEYLTKEIDLDVKKEESRSILY